MAIWPFFIHRFTFADSIADENSRQNDDSQFSFTLICLTTLWQSLGNQILLQNRSTVLQGFVLLWFSFFLLLMICFG
jgi:hypothetical protein